MNPKLEKANDFLRRPKKKSCKEILWNPETKEFLGRTASGWGESVNLPSRDYFPKMFFAAKSIIFYLLFYVGLALFTAMCWSVFATTLNDHHPKYTDINSKTPGLGPMNLNPADSRRFPSFVRVQRSIDFESKFDGKRFHEVRLRNSAFS